MVEPTLLSPNTGNYQVGKGKCFFTPEGGDEIDLGNVTEMEFTPSLDKLDHFSSMEGTKSKDLTVIIQKGGQLRIVMEEFTAFNLSLMLLGTRDELAADGPEVQIFDQNSVNGSFRYQATNEVGPKWDLFFHNVSFTPTGSINPISDEWNNMEVTADVLVSQTAPNVGKFGYAKLTNLEGAS
jgi:hypothetical protein